MFGRTRTRTRRFPYMGLAGLLLSLALITTYLPASAAEPAPPEVVAPAQTLVGYVGPEYGSAPNSTPTGEKPESKLWWNDGRWWGAMFSASANAYRIMWLNLSTQTWQDSGTSMGNRARDKVDVLWDQGSQKLYIVSHVFSTSPSSSGGPTQLFRYSYNSSSKTYALDAGFPVGVAPGSAEALVIEKDSTGRLWIAYVQSRTPLVAHSTTNDQTWATPFQIPGSALATSDDIASMIAFGGNKVGVAWSDQGADAYYFAIHGDGAPTNQWTIETAIKGSNLVDDHINLATDNSGRVYLAGKTSLTGDNPLVVLDVRSATGSWARSVFGMDVDGHTRPIVVADSQNQQIYLFATSPESGGAIYYKAATMGDRPSFPTGKGTVVMQPSSGGLNNVTSTKQQVNSATGLVVLASNSGTLRYHHNYLPLGGSPPPTTPPPTTTTPTPTTTTPTPTTTTPTPTTTTPTPTTTTPTPTPTTTTPTPTPTTTTPTTTPPPGGQLVFSPAADTHVKTDRATSNYGSETYVRVRKTASVDYDSYFKFNITGTGGQVASAVLRLYSYDGSPDGGAISLTSNNYLNSTTAWTESGLTWNNAPGPVGGVLDSAGNVITNTWIELDVSAAINGDGIVSFVLSNQDDNSAFYYSKEATSLRPELIVYTSGSVTPTTPAPTATTPTPTPTTTTPTPTTTTPTPTPTLTTTPPPGGQLVLTPYADTHVKTDRPTSNYGSEPYLRVRKTVSVDYDTYLKFFVTGTGGQVTSAVLKLYSYDGGPDGGTIYLTSNNYLNSTTAWAESGLTWNNAPGPISAALDSAGQVANNSWIELDVSAAIPGDGAYSFLLTNQDTNSVFYYSKEAANFQPRLEIQTGASTTTLSLPSEPMTQPLVEQRAFEVQDPDIAEPAVVTPTPTAPSEPAVATPAPLVYSLPYADNFTSGDGWIASGAWQFDPLAGRNSGGWFAHSAVRRQSSSLQLNGLIDLTAVLSPTLTYWQKSILTGGDRVVVEASVDGGQTWLALSEETGTVGEWAQRSVDLLAVSGQVIGLRFRLDATGDLPAGTTSVGLWLDDVAVSLIELTPTPTANIPTNEPTPIIETSATEEPPALEPPAVEFPTIEPPAEEPAAPPSTLLTVESDDPAVVTSGLWTAHETVEASGGRYVYTSGNLTDSLSLGFSGTQVDVVFVTHPALGSFAVEIDGVQLQIVSTTGETSFGARTSITGLADGAHTLRIVPTSGTIAIDAFAVADLAPLAPQPPTADPTAEPTEAPIVEPPTGPTEEPTALPQPDIIVPSLTPTSTPLPVLLPYFDSFEVEQTWVAEGSWLYAPNAGYTGSGWVASAAERGQISTLTLAYQLDLRAAQAPQLSVWQTADLQGDDFVSLEVSVDSGLSWLPIDIQPGWKGAWMQRTVDLTGFRGTVLALRFVLAAGPSNQGNGSRPSTLGIDELVVQEAVAPTAMPLPTTAPTTIPTTAPALVPEVVAPDPATPTPEPTLPPTDVPTQEPTLTLTEAPQEPMLTEEVTEGGAE